MSGAKGWADMDETVFVAAMSLVGTLGGSLFGVLASSRLTSFRLEQLETKVEKLGEIIEKTYKLEEKVNNLEAACSRN